MPRYLSIDVMRGIAILLMVQTHFVENLSAPDESVAYDWVYGISQYLGMFPAPLFAFVSGLSFCLWTRNQKLQGRHDDAVTKVGVRRGLFLFVLGIAFNFFVWLPEQIFNWDILTLIGTTLIFLAFARKLPVVILILICIVVSLLSPALRVVVDYPAYWDEAEYSYDFTLLDVLTGFIANGYFPLLPWLIFPIAGFIVGEVAFKPNADAKKSAWRVGGVGLAMLLLAAIAAFIGNQAPTLLARNYTDDVSEFPANTSFVFGSLGVCLLSMMLLHRGIDRADARWSTGVALKFLSRCSAYSLTIYIMHHIVHLWPLWLYAVYRNQDDPQYYWRQAISPPLALAFSAAFIVACYLLLMLRDRPWRYTFESLMRWLCD